MAGKKKETTLKNVHACEILKRFKYLFQKSNKKTLAKSFEIKNPLDVQNTPVRPADIQITSKRILKRPIDVSV